MQYRVHSFHAMSVAVEAETAKGTKVPGVLPGFSVELLPVDGGKTVSLEVTEENYAGLPPAEMFAVGNLVSLGFTLVEAAKPAAA